MKNKKSTYLRLLREAMTEIALTPKSNPERFKLLKKKANKYLLRYQQCQ